MTGMNKLKEFKAVMKLWETKLDALCSFVLSFLLFCASLINLHLLSKSVA